MERPTASDANTATFVSLSRNSSMSPAYFAFGRRDFLTTTFVGTAAAFVLPAIEGSPSYAQ